jgi:PAS domain S-box-containing protein
VLLTISSTVSRAQVLEDMYVAIHAALGTVIDTTNFFIALYDEKNDALTFPYWVDTVDVHSPVVIELSRKESLSGEVIRSGRPLLVRRAEVLARHGSSALEIPPCTVAEVWLGVPLQTGEKMIGVMAVQSYIDPDLYGEDDAHLLASVAGQVAQVIERKRWERDLRDSVAYLESVFRAAPVGIGVNVNRVFRQVNQRLCEMTGYASDELIGRNARMLYLDDAGYEYVGRVKYEQIRQYGTGTVETRWLRRDGRVIDVLLSSTPLDVSDLSKGVTFTALDITDRKQAEAERERLMIAIEQAGEIIVITDPDGNVTYANPAFHEISGYGPEETIGRNLRLLKSGRQDAAFYRDMWAEISRGRTWKGHITNRRKDGTLYVEDMSISPVFDDTGRIVNYVAVKRDITDHLRMTEQLQQAQKMEAIARLTGGVAHDFNNILMIIIGYSEMALEQTGGDSLLRSNIEKILDAAQRSAGIVRQLLAFARKQTIAPVPLNLNESVGRMLTIIHRLIGEDIELSWKTGKDLWLVNMDPAQVDQLLANLCVNARDAIDGIGRITISTGNICLGEEYLDRFAGLVPGDYVGLTVSDDGCGMDRETREHIFEPFFTTKDVGHGTGLGLATVYGIVKQNYGHIEVSSEPGGGATFIVYLPRYSGTAVRPAGEEQVSHRKHRGETILLVEDDPTILDMEKKMLEGFGYTVLAADRPHQALQLAEKFGARIDLLITDVIMPEMNGWDLAEQLAARHPQMAQLFMSGYTADIIARHGVLTPGVHFIQKPFMVRELSEKIRELLDARGEGNG